MNNLVRVKLYEDNHYIIRRLSNKGINIYNIEYFESGNIYTIDLHDLDRLPVDTEVLSFNGFRGLILKIKYNIHFIIALLLSILLMIFMSFIVVRVDVVHNDKHIRELLQDELDEYGIHPLTIKKSFGELQQIKKNIKDKYPEDIEWFEIIDDGMKYTVRVEERIITKEEEKSPYCDIESVKDAIVLSSKVRDGQTQVDAGDMVKKGSILVSGAIKFNDEIKSYTCADADVYGNSWYTVNVSIPYNYTDKLYSGKTKFNIAFEYGSKRTSIFKIHFKEYDTKRKALLSIGKFTLYKEKSREYTSIKKKYSESDAYDIALELGRKKILTNLDETASILDEKVLQSNTYDSIIEMDIFYSVKELIGKQIEKQIETIEGVGEDELTE